jgi:hypothetical protein
MRLRDSLKRPGGIGELIGGIFMLLLLLPEMILIGWGLARLLIWFSSLTLRPELLNLWQAAL